MSKGQANLSVYRGQWGGKIESGEEMWWTEVNPRLARGSRPARMRFFLDSRQHFVLSFVKNQLGNPAANLANPPLIVDYGCGTGGSTLNYSFFLDLPLHGFDIFQTQIEIARNFAKQYGNASQFNLLTAEGNFPYPDRSVDILVSTDVLGHVPNIPTVLQEWARVMKPGGIVSLFTEATYSPGDKSLMARLARDGMDMCLSVPEHISLYPREQLEKWFVDAGFEVLDRYSPNVLHWFFFPTDYVQLFRREGKRGFLYRLSFVWMKIQKISPFYPVSFELVRLLLIRIFGRKAYGTNYFYRLRRKT